MGVPQIKIEYEKGKPGKRGKRERGGLVQGLNGVEQFETNQNDRTDER